MSLGESLEAELASTPPADRCGSVCPGRTDLVCGRQKTHLTDGALAREAHATHDPDPAAVPAGQLVTWPEPPPPATAPSAP